MKKIIRLTERDLTRLVKRIIREQEEEVAQSTSTDLPLCSSLMTSDPNMPGSETNLNGPFDKITGNFSVSPEYQGLTVHQNNRPYCFIPKS